MVQISTLVRSAALGAGACVAISAGYQSLITNKVRKTTYFQEAMEILRSHAAARLLGEPIHSGYVDVFSGKSFADDKKANIYVNVKGSKYKGALLINAIKHIENEGWLLKKIELTMKDEAGGTLLIYERDTDSDTENSDSDKDYRPDSY